MIFYRTDCRRHGRWPKRISTRPSSLRPRSVVVTGTHFSRPNSDAAPTQGDPPHESPGVAKVVFDIDYRPNLWWSWPAMPRVFERYVKSDRVSGQLKTVLPDCDLIVGTEEEIMIASGAGRLPERAEDNPLIVLSYNRAEARAPRAASSMTARSAMTSRDGIVGKGLCDRDLQCARRRRRLHVGLPARLARRCESFATSATWANACGAFAVSRLLCAPEYPTFRGAAILLEARPGKHLALRKDEAINHIHWGNDAAGVTFLR